MHETKSNKILVGLISSTLLILLSLTAISAWEIYTEPHLDLLKYDYVSITQQLLC